MNVAKECINIIFFVILILTKKRYLMMCPKRGRKGFYFPSDNARSRVRLVQTPKFELAFWKNENKNKKFELS